MDLITTVVSASERMRRENLVSSTRNIVMEKMQIGGSSTRLIEVRKCLLSIKCVFFLGFFVKNVLWCLIHTAIL